LEQTFEFGLFAAVAGWVFGVRGVEVGCCAVVVLAVVAKRVSWNFMTKCARADLTVSGNAHTGRSRPLKEGMIFHGHGSRTSILHDRRPG